MLVQLKANCTGSWRSGAELCCLPAVEGVAVSWSRNAKKTKEGFLKITAIASGWQIASERA